MNYWERGKESLKKKFQLPCFGHNEFEEQINCLKQQEQPQKL